MSFLAEKFTILQNKAAGLIVLLIILSSCVYWEDFQEPSELPKLIVWLIGIGIILIALYFIPKLSLKLPKSVVYLLAMLALTFMLNPLFSLDKINSIFGVAARFISSSIFFVTWVVFILIINIFEAEVKKQFLKVTIGISGAIAIWGILQNYGVGYYQGLDVTDRLIIPSFLGNPNFSAMFIVATVPLQIWLVSTARSSRQFFFYFIVLLLSLYSLILFNSRGAYLGLGMAILGLIWILLSRKKYLHTVILVLGITLISVVGWSYYQSYRVDSASITNNVNVLNTEHRLLVWDLAFNAIIHKPLAGVGLGNFFLAFRDSTNTALRSMEWFDDAHNVVLQIFATCGVVTGLLLLTLVVLSLYWDCKRFIKYKEGFAGAVATSIIVWLVVGSFTPVTLSNWMLLALFLSMSFSYTAVSTEFSVNKMVKIVCLVLGVIIIVIGAGILTSEIFLWRASLALSNGSYQSAQVLSSYSVLADPFNTNARLSNIQSLIKLNQFDKTEKATQKYERLHPKSSGVFKSSASTYISLFDLTNNEKYKQEADTAIQKMIDLNNNYTGTLQAATQFYFELKESTKAEQTALQSVVFNSDSSYSWTYYAKSQYDLGNKEKTIFALKKLYKIQPTGDLRNLIQQMERVDNIQDITFPYQI